MGWECSRPREEDFREVSQRHLSYSVAMGTYSEERRLPKCPACLPVLPDRGLCGGTPMLRTGMLGMKTDLNSFLPAGRGQTCSPT